MAQVVDNAVEGARSTLAAAAHHAAPKASHRLKGKVAVVTGASSGIGRAISVAYGREGAKVVIADLRDSSRASAEDVATHELIKKEGGEAEYMKIDVTNFESVEGVAKAVKAKFGRLDIWVNNAGIIHEPTNSPPIWDAPLDGWQKTFDVNATGVFHGTKAASKIMYEQEPLESGDRGWIVNLASVFGLVAWYAAPAYVASKHAVVGLTKAAALDCAAYRVHVNAICPGWVASSFTAGVFEDTNVKQMAEGMHPFRGVGKPDDVAGVAVFLASEDAKWVTGTTITVDGAYSAQ